MKRRGEPNSDKKEGTGKKMKKWQLTKLFRTHVHRNRIHFIRHTKKMKNNKKWKPKNEKKWQTVERFAQHRGEMKTDLRPKREKKN